MFMPFRFWRIYGFSAIALKAAAATPPSWWDERGSDDSAEGETAVRIGSFGIESFGASIAS